MQEEQLAAQAAALPPIHLRLKAIVLCSCSARCWLIAACALTAGHAANA